MQAKREKCEPVHKNSNSEIGSTSRLVGHANDSLARGGSAPRIFGGGIPSKGEIDKAKDLRTSAESMLKFIGFDPRHGRRRLRPLYERSSQLEGQRRLGGGTRHLRR